MFVNLIKNLNSDKIKGLKKHYNHVRVLEVGANKLYAIEIFVKDKIARGFGRTKEEAINKALANS